MIVYIIVGGVFLVMFIVLLIFMLQKEDIMIVKPCPKCDRTAYMCECDANGTNKPKEEKKECKCDGGKCQCSK